MRGKDLIGQRFGRLVVIEKLPSKNKRCWWKCKCDCGNFKDVPTKYLTSGTTQSCGCLNKIKSENAKKAAKKSAEVCTTHGLSNTRIYSIWKNMIYRCENSKAAEFKLYGGRGIKVCEEWHDIRKFQEWAMINGYKEGLEIDRVDVDGNYEPLNCRWATRKQQNNNKRNNVKAEINGEIHTLAEWSEITGITINTLQYRYYRGDRGKRLIRKVDLENYDIDRKATSNTGITGISRRKSGSFQIDVMYKKKRYSASAKTLEEAIAKKEEIIKNIKGSEAQMDEFCYVCGSPNVELHHICFRSKSKQLTNAKINHVYLCPEHHRGDFGPHGKYGRELDIKLKLELQNKLEMLFDKEYLTEQDVNDVLKISNSALKSLLKPLKREKEGYERISVIRQIMGGRLYE